MSPGRICDYAGLTPAMGKMVKWGANVMSSY
jgi:hypothetical protein